MAHLRAGASGIGAIAVAAHGAPASFTAAGHTVSARATAERLLRRRSAAVASSAVTASPTVINFLLNQASVDQELASFVELNEPRRSWDEVNIQSEVKSVLRNLARHVAQLKRAAIPRIVIFEGRKGVGRRLAAEAFAYERGAKLLTMDLNAARASGEPLVKLASHLLLHQRLYDAVIFISGGEMLFDKEGHLLPEAATFIHTLYQTSKQVLIASAPGHRWQEAIETQPFLLLPFPELSVKERALVWQQAAKGHGWTIPMHTLHEIAIVLS